MSLLTQEKMSHRLNPIYEGFIEQLRSATKKGTKGRKHRRFFSWSFSGQEKTASQLPHPIQLPLDCTQHFLQGFQVLEDWRKV